VTLAWFPLRIAAETDPLVGAWSWLVWTSLPIVRAKRPRRMPRQYGAQRRTSPARPGMGSPRHPGGTVAHEMLKAALTRDIIPSQNGFPLVGVTGFELHP
jgi:hypothetical protein